MRQGIESDLYECWYSDDGEQLFIKGNNTEDTLMMVSETAQNAFLALLEERYCDGMDIKSWYEHKRIMKYT